MIFKGKTEEHIKELFNICVLDYIREREAEADIDFESKIMEQGYHDFKLWYYNFFLGITLKEDENEDR